MNAKHTPGPWVLNSDGTRHVVTMPSGDPIAYVEPWMAEVGEHLGDVGLADARLIAAAPELLEVVKAFRAAYAQQMSDDIREDIDSVLAKAEGRS